MLPSVSAIGMIRSSRAGETFLPRDPTDHQRTDNKVEDGEHNLFRETPVSTLANALRQRYDRLKRRGPPATPGRPSPSMPP